MLVIFGFIYGKVLPIFEISYLVLFVLIVAIFVIKHKKIKNKYKYLLAEEIMYNHKIWRYNKNFAQIPETLIKFINNMKNIIDNIITKYFHNNKLNHLYANDLDLYTTFMPWINTCSTYVGQKKLCEHILLDSIIDKSLEKRISFQKDIFYLSTKNELLDKIEVEKFVENGAFAFLQIEENINSINNNENINVTSKDFFILLTSIIAWIVIIGFGLYNYFMTTNTSVLINSVGSYFIFPIIAAFLLEKLTNFYSLKTEQINIIFYIYNTFNKLDNDFINNYDCLQHKNIYALKKIKKLLEILQIRKNPIAWLLIHIIMPFDSIILLIIAIYNKKYNINFDKMINEIAIIDELCAWARMTQESKDEICYQLLNNNINHNIIVARDIAHPLIMVENRISNDFYFSNEQKMLLLTGSNMSGKSTFLRTIAINLMLNNIGVPVFAAQFNAPRVKILCAIKIEDSLSQNASYFYSEVIRLKMIFDEIKQQNAFNQISIFFIDEIFRGTNNKERSIGSFSVIEILINSGAYGIVSTHDLSLAEIANKDNRAKNYHFRETIHNEHKLVFDYKLKEGPSTSANALLIMKNNGLFEQII